MPNAILDKITANETQTAYDLYSFDIFDTLITRTTATPRGIFAIMQDVLLKDEKYKNIPDFIKKNFYDLRLQYEMHLRDMMRRNYEKEDIDFDFIYDQFAENYTLPEEDKNALKQLELDTEYKNILPITQNIDRVKELINTGARVVLISDMYHSEKTIRSFLCKCDDIFENIPIYVSSAYGKTKITKGLFKIVQEAENVNCSKWLHFGDNIRVDINPARDFGIKAQHYKYIGLEDYEKEVLKKLGNNSFIQLAIGASKNARLFTPDMTPQKKLGCSFAACLYVGYIEWLISESQRQGIKRLYFLARDGYLLQKMFDIIAKARGVDIETKYIYGSRAAWRLPAVSEIGLKRLMELNVNIFTIETMAKNFGISKNKLLELLPDKYKNNNEFLTREELTEIGSILDTNENFKKYLCEKYETQRELIRKYFQQEIDSSDEHWAIVDAFGSGYTQTCFKAILKKIYDKPVKTFYLSLSIYKTLEDNYCYCHCHFISSMIEIFLRAPHGVTLNYTCGNQGTVIPVLDKNETDAIMKWGFNDFTDGLIAFYNFYAKSSLENKEIAIPAISLLSEYCTWAKTTKNAPFANLVGSIPFARKATGNHDEVFLKKYKTKELLKEFIQGKKTFTCMENLSWARCSNNARKIWNLKKEYKSLRKFVINIYTNRKQRKAELCILGKKISFRKLLWGRK